MRKLFFLILLFYSSFLKAQEYATSNIPDSLLINADAVIRKETREFTLKSPSKAIEKYDLIVTILNKNAEEYNNLGLSYDKLSRIEELSASLINKEGTVIKEFKTSDFTDRSLISSFSIYEDSRAKVLQINYPTYPYTIKFSYQINHNSLLSYPSWYPQSDFRLSVQKSTYELSHPSEMKVRFKLNKLPIPAVQGDDKTKSIKFSIHNLKAYAIEPLSAGLNKITPWALFGPTNFEYDGSSGDLSDWNAYGKWLYNLSAGLDVLPNDIKIKVHELTDNLTNEKDKIRVLYKYLQAKSRYVSVQLGIGGLKPFEATKVAQNNYGDCKALSNYMLALLKEANIKSYLTVVGANPKGGLRNDFASANQANHMILCVPLQKDTVWLECTSQRSPFNYLGSFTEGRNVLLISPSGGQIVKTPALKPSDSQQLRKINVFIDSLGNARIKLHTQYTGEQFEDIQHQLYNEIKEQKDYIYSTLQTPNVRIEKINYSLAEKDMPKIEENLDLTLDNIFVNGGNNKFVTLNLFNKKSYVPEIVPDRKTDFRISMNYHDYDEVIYELPKNYKVEFIPKETQIKTDFGIYTSSTTMSDNKIIYKREQKMFKSTYPAEKFNDLVAFYKTIYKADKQKAVLVMQ